MAEYTPYETEVSYERQYPDMIEFEKPWETTIQVSQGDGMISKDGTPLQSEDFASCFGVILRNQSNLDSTLFHVDDICLTYRQTPMVNELMRNYVNSLDIDPSERESLLAAMDDITRYKCPQNYGRMKREDFKSRMQELNSEGIIQARFIRGTQSRNCKSRVIENLFGFLGIDVLDDITVDTGRQHWDMVYKPEENKVLANSRSQKKVLTYNY